MDLFKVVYQLLIADVVNRDPIAPAPRQRIREKTKSLIFLIFTISVYQNIGSTANTKILCGVKLKTPGRE